MHSVQIYCMFEKPAIIEHNAAKCVKIHELTVFDEKVQTISILLS